MISLGYPRTSGPALAQASNGPPSSDPHSLHRPYDPAAGGSPWNEYQQALIAVGEILAPYDRCEGGLNEGQVSWRPAAYDTSLSQ